ncbi:MAG: SprB repeat-containing protein, partial [Saprospiraceae bacterium]|nr:SprB repeat-containing protein [Saprospiraceae bacterium]MDW8482683.1 SprB repeat-containing protein [Saprospiraceae bacterium]
MNKYLLLLLAWVIAANASIGQTAADVVVPITVTTNSNPPSITLTFPARPTDTLTVIGRKLINQTQWQAIRLPSNATTFTDVNVSVGVGYEYIVVKRGTGVPNTRIGLTYAGIQVASPTYRGKLVLIVDNVLSGPLAAELSRFVQDLRGDGWQVIRHDINVATSTVSSVKAILRNEYNKDPENVVAALLFGNIPVPYSGNIAPDGHTDHQGAWPTDYYYGDMDESAWTDNTVNNSNAARPANRNVPGDGKFDQSLTPTLAEIVVSRVDFSNLTTGWGVSQTELYRRYLNKNHAFRTGAYKPANQTLVDDNFGFFNEEAFAQNGFRNGYTLTGPTSVQALDFFNDTKNRSFLLGYGCGAGTYTSANGVGTSANFQTDSVNIVFSMLFGSYFGDWDFENNPFMPSALASKGGILTCSWAGRPNWHLHHMALGEPIMTSTFWVWLNSFLQFPVYPPNLGSGLIHAGLLGDPTLRAHAVRPARNLTATAKCGSIQLSWEASPDAQLGYLVYWAEHPDSVYQLISNPVIGTSFIDSFPISGNNYYMVRALRLEQVPTGSYFNQSTGIFASAFYEDVPVELQVQTTDVSCNGDANGSASVVATGGTSFTYQWSNGATTATITGLAPDLYTVTVTNNYGCTAEAEVLIQEPDPLNVETITFNPSCAGADDGSVFLTVRGGTPTYSYAWATGQTTSELLNVPAGTISGTVTDANGCTIEVVVTLTEPDPLDIVLKPFDILCGGTSTGRIETNVSGGTLPYTYRWSNNSTGATLQNVPAGTYTVTVTDFNGCVIEAEATLNESPPIVISGEVSNAGCAGAATGRVLLTVSGGAGGYIYAWSNNTTAKDLENVAAGTYTVTVADASGCTRAQTFIVGQATDLEVTTITSPVRCFGEATGNATANVSGGTPNYTYLWSNNATTPTTSNLPAGTYTVTVTDAAGCSQTATAVIAQPPAISATAEWTALPCRQDIGNVTLTVTGGTPSYSFLWSNGATTQNLSNVPPAPYTVEIKDLNGCTKVVVANVVQPAPPLQSQMTFVQTSCPGVTPVTGTLTVVVSGGTPGYQYAWSNNASTPTQSNVPLGTYTVTITDAAGCTRVDNNLFVQRIPDWDLTGVVKPVTCPGGSDGAITLTVGGASGGYTFLWSNGLSTQNLTNLSPGIYTPTVTDSRGCTTSTTFVVPAPPLFNVSVTVKDVSCPGGNDGAITLTVNGGTPPYTYLWSNAGTTPSISNLTAGAYACTITDSKGCTTTAQVIVQSPTPPTVNLIGADTACVDT